MFFRIIKYTENTSKYAGLKGIKPVKLLTQNVKKIRVKSVEKFLIKTRSNMHRRESWILLFRLGHFDS